jgi:hypothetical protein
MLNSDEHLLDDIVHQISNIKRKILLPWWIKIFMWVFLIFGILGPFGLIFGLFGYKFHLSLYGLDTNDPLSLAGICIILLFLFKGIISYCLLTENDSAIKLGVIDAITGIVICILVMITPMLNPGSNTGFSFRIELLFLIPYLNKMLKIRRSWETVLLTSN